jgi:hypothetical protein
MEAVGVLQQKKKGPKQRVRRGASLSDKKTRDETSASQEQAICSADGHKTETSIFWSITPWRLQDFFKENVCKVNLKQDLNCGGHGESIVPDMSFALRHYRGRSH